MAINCTTPMSAIEQEIADRIEILQRQVIEILKYVGERVVKHARELPSPNVARVKGVIPPHQPHYIDWTVNLRSSIGYVIVKDGKIVQSGGFDAGSDGKNGADAGRSYAESVARNFIGGISLIVVAGEHYASYVTDKGYDVIDSAELVAEQLFNDLIKQL